MSINLSTSLAAVLAAASFAVSLGAGPAAAASRDRHAAIAHHRGAARWHHRPYFVHRDPVPVYDDHRLAEYDYNHPRRSGPYIYIPGRGILNESCNLPTSACTNEYRDIQ